MGPCCRRTARPLTRGLVVWMKAPHSYTGEDVAEFHLQRRFGTGPLADAKLPDAGRSAARQPGEFTLRAFLNGKLDLAQAEAVQQLIQSRSQLAARLAKSGSCWVTFPLRSRRFARTCCNWLALLEAEIDFGDEVPGLPSEQSLQRWTRAHDRLERMLQQGQGGKALADGLRTVILGAPNAGKIHPDEFAVGSSASSGYRSGRHHPRHPGRAPGGGGYLSVAGGYGRSEAYHRRRRGASGD